MKSDIDVRADLTDPPPEGDRMRTALHHPRRLAMALAAATVLGLLQTNAAAQVVSDASTDLPAASVSGEAMPTWSSSEWTQVFADDFSTPTQSFPGPYASSWSDYKNFPDTSGNGRFSSNAISVHDGMMDLHLRTVDGVPQAAAPMPLLKRDGHLTGMHYGRYAVRFKADALRGYKTAWLLWPDSNNHAQGEIDFPEGNLWANILGFDHTVNNPSFSSLSVNTQETYTSWHTAVIEWVPSGVSFYLDGILMGHSTMSPTASMHWVLQTETALSATPPPASSDGHVYIDWVAAWSYNRASASPAAAPTPPSQPLQPSATAGSDSATISWHKPVSDGGSPITGYRVTGTPGGSCVTTGTVCQISNLTASTPYSFHVQAVNTLGESAPSDPVTATPSAAPGTPDPSGQVMPNGNLPGWHQVFADDFDTATQTFPGPYAADWSAYKTYGTPTSNGSFATNTISTHDGLMDLHLHTTSGVPQLAAPIPLIGHDGKLSGQLYGRYAVRFRADGLAGFRANSMLWPTNNEFADGNIQFPEGGLSATIRAVDHKIGNPAQNALNVDTKTTFSGWHTAVIDWLPSGVSYYLDNKLVGTSSVSPRVAMYWVLKMDTVSGHAPDAAVNGHVLIDWVSVWAPTTATTATSDVAEGDQPAPVTAVAAVARNRSAVVTWSPPRETAGVTPTRFTVWRAGSRVCVTTAASCRVSGLTNGTRYCFRVATEYAGATSAPRAANCVIPRASTRLTVVKARTHVRAGKTIKVTALLRAVGGQPVRHRVVSMQCRASATHGSFHACGRRATTSAHGVAKFATLRAKHSMTVRFRFAGSRGLRSSLSTTRRITVRT